MPYLKTCLFSEIEKSRAPEVRSKEGRQIEAATVGEAIRVAEELLDIRITPDFYKGYPVFRTTNLPECEFRLVGISIYRNPLELNPHHDLDFPLLGSDVVGIGVLAA